MAPPDLMRAPDGTAFDIHGPLDAPAVVLIHGLGLNRAVWDLTQPALTPHYRVLRYDLLGHGQTPGPTDRPDLPLLTRQLAALMDYLHLPNAALVGFSLGGMIARHFAQSHPARVTALALLHTPHRRTAAAQAAIALSPVFGPILRQTRPGMCEYSTASGEKCASGVRPARQLRPMGETCLKPSK